MTKTSGFSDAFKAIIIFLSAGTGRAFAAQPTDTIIIPRELKEVEITTVGQRKLITSGNDGEIRISSSLLSELPSFLGGNDPMFLLRSLPSVGTANELSPAVSVRGSASGANLFESDGIRIINPMHMLGIYSAFNSDFYSGFTFRPGAAEATSANLTGGYFGAVSMETAPDPVLAGSVSAGLIESHGALRLPIVKGKSSLAIGARTSYLNLLYPDLLKAGSSTLTYDFSDMNAHFMWMPDSCNMLRISFFGDKDRLMMHNQRNGTKEGRFGWENIAAGIEWLHGNFAVRGSYSSFSNNFFLQEAGREINLPSAFRQATLSLLTHVGTVSLECDLNHRFSSGQGIRQEKSDIPGRSSAMEMNVAGTWSKPIGADLLLRLGMRATLYSSRSYHTVEPQPRVSLKWNHSPVFSIFAAAGRYMRFDKIVEETNNGLPADFYVNTDVALPPDEVYSAELGISGVIPRLGCQYTVEGYYKILRNVTEYKGSLLSLVNTNYNPLEDVINGRGFSTGLSFSLMRQWGRLRGRISYNLGKSRLKFTEYGDSYFPSAHDRLHDFNATLSWSVSGTITVNASFVHATGTPYTRAKYGYMIGENLICEYYPHNSSRLPAYNRMDMSGTWIFSRSRRSRQSLTFSVYNLLGNKNVLFTFTTYSPDKGLRTKESVMKMVIPSLTYTLAF